MCGYGVVHACEWYELFFLCRIEQISQVEQVWCDDFLKFYLSPSFRWPASLQNLTKLWRNHLISQIFVGFFEFICLSGSYTNDNWMLNAIACQLNIGKFHRRIQFLVLFRACDCVCIYIQGNFFRYGFLCGEQDREKKCKCLQQ